MVTPQTHRFNARLEPFAAVRALIETFCVNTDVPDHTRENLILIVDELSENTIRHGYASADEAGADWPIWLTLSVAGAEIVVLYEDAAPPHNPFDNIVPPDYSGPAESWRIGGWGVPIISRFSGNLRYEFSCGHNRIHFTLPALRTEV